MVRSRPLLDRSRPKVGRGFLRFFSQFHLRSTNIVVSGHTKNYGKTRKTKGIYGKTRKPLRRRETLNNAFVFALQASVMRSMTSCQKTIKIKLYLTIIEVKHDVMSNNNPRI